MGKRKHILTAITIICIIVIAVSNRNTASSAIFRNSIGVVIAPIQGVFSSSGNWFQQRIDFVVQMKNYKQENESLKLKIAKLENNLRKFEKYEQENRDLRNKLEYKNHYTDYPVIGAEIIARDPSNWTDYFLIDKGSQDGIEQDMVVLTERGLVGSIVEVSVNYAKVRTILNEDLSVSVEIKRTKDFGILSGERTISKENASKMSFIDPNAELVLEDEVLTSGLGGLFPRGIYVGKISAIKKESYESTKYAVIQSDINFKKLDKVLVIRHRWDNYKNIFGE